MLIELIPVDVRRSLRASELLHWSHGRRHHWSKKQLLQLALTAQVPCGD